MIKTIGYDQHEIIRDIMSLHCPDGIDCDLTYSKGNFYKTGIPKPKYKFDLDPQVPGTIQADSRAIPLGPESLNSIMFDPPFIGASRKNGKPGIIKSRFGYYKNIPLLWEYYRETLIECYRVLKRSGILIFKCQDTVESAKQYFSHAQIMNYAVNAGFYPKDFFILLAKSRLMSPNMINQQHARKYHCYFWVFKKEQSKVVYEGVNV